MRIVKIRQKDISKATVQKVDRQHVVQNRLDQKNATKYGMDLYFTEAKKRIKEGETVLLKLISEKKEFLKIRVTKTNEELQFNIEDYAEQLGVPKEEIQERAYIATEQSKTLGPKELFKHPLAASKEINGKETLNMWLMATFLINDVRDAYDDEEGSKNLALVEKNLKKIINIIEPLTDANNLVDEIKEHKVTAMQRVANIIGLAPPEKAMKINKLMN